MLDLNDHHYFVHAVDHGGFAAAGRALDIPKSTISRRVIELESRLGVRLIERTSRSFALTDVGRDFYQHAKAMLIEAEAAEHVVRRRLAEPSGTVRLTCSPGMSNHLQALLARFLASYPKVNLVLYATNRNVDLVEEGFDIGVRGQSGSLPDSDLVQRRITDTPWHAFASPGYLRLAGEPNQPVELTGHATLALGAGEQRLRWRLRNDAHSIDVPIHPRLQTSDMSVLKAAALADLGITSLPAYAVRSELAAGTLVRVLTSWVTQYATISLLTPSRRGQLPSVRALLDFIAAEFPRIVEHPDEGRDS